MRTYADRATLFRKVYRLMSRRYSIFVTVLFCAFLFGFGIAHFILPDKDFSEQENRYLSQFKAPTPDTLRSGKFMEDFEDYITDQFPLRDQWIRLKALSERTLGKQENNGVYFGTDGQTLFAQYTAPGADDLAQRVGFVNKLADNLDVPVYFSLVPDKSYVWADRLPANAPNVDDGSVNETVKALVNERLNYIDLYGALRGDDVFYRTDHHWSTMGAYMAYLHLAGDMGGSATILDSEPTLVSDSFYGTTWSSCGAGWVKPDEIYTWVPEGAFLVTRYPEGAPIESTLYDLSKLETKDKYSMFLGGNQPLCVIRNPLVEGGKKLLVIRDSYSDSLAPFLALDYQEVHLFDLRYNNMSLKQYVADNGIDRVLVLYSASNFSTDANLFKLGY